LSPNLVRLCLETRKGFQKGQNSEKVFWVRVPVRVVSVARKLCMIEEQRQNQNCLEDYRTKSHNPEKLSWVRVPLKIFCTVEANYGKA
jgi:hypothetical protein